MGDKLQEAARGDELEPVRVGFFTYGSSLYGANQSMLGLIEGLKTHGVESLVFFPEGGPLSSQLAELGIKGVQAPYRNCVHWPSKLPNRHPRRCISNAANVFRAVQKSAANYCYSAGMAKACSDFGADWVVSNTTSVDVGLVVAKRLGLPHIWHVREFGDLDWDFLPDFGFHARRRAMNRSSRVFFISEAVARHHFSQCSLSESRKFRVIYNSVAGMRELASRGEFSERESSDQPPFVFGIAGFIKPSKGQFDAVSAFDVLVRKGLDVRFRVAGGGGVEELLQHVERLGVRDKVEILGHLSGAQMSEFYRGIDCGLMCSVAEGFGRTTVEYMSWGKPVIGRNSGATPELVRDGENGLLYDHSVDALARAMETMVADPVRCRAMGLAAAQFAANFSNERVASDFLAALN